MKLNKQIPAFFEYRNVIDAREFSYDFKTNDIFFTYAEAVMKKDIEDYYKNYAHVFYQRDTTIENYSGSVITPEGVKMLEKIKLILDKQKTNYRIVIYPNYNQWKINPADVNKLQDIFEKNNVFDYTGINEITNDIHNYYENDHCRPVVGQKIMSEIYR